MAIDWGKVRSAMTQTPDYNPGARGAGGTHYGNVPGYKGTGYGTNQYNWGRNFGSRPQAGGGADYMSTIGTPNRVTAAPVADQNALANARTAMTGAYGMDEEQKDTGGISRFTTPMIEMAKTILPVVSGTIGDITRANRLNKAYKEAGIDWEADKRKMMTAKERDFHDKYMRLADMTQDREKRQEYLKVAESAWRNKQTSDRLAAIQGFEDYAPDKYFGPNVSEAGRDIPGGRRLTEALGNVLREGPLADIGTLNLLQRQAGEPQSYLNPFDDSLREDAIARANTPLVSGIDYDAMGLAPDPENDLLYGDPGTLGIRPEIRSKPDRYNPYRDEDYGAPLRNIDPYEGIYESPLTDTLYSEELVDATPYLPGHSKHRYLPRDTVAIEGMGGGMNAFPSMDITEDLEEDRGIGPGFNVNEYLRNKKALEMRGY